MADDRPRGFVQSGRRVRRVKVAGRPVALRLYVNPHGVAAWCSSPPQDPPPPEDRHGSDWQSGRRRPRPEGP